MNQKIKIIIKILFPVFIMLTIFYFSSQESASSNQQSDFFSERLKFLPLEYHSIFVLVRKSAHFIAFSLLGFSLFILFKTIRWPLTIAVFYAIFDEFHQLFIQGRSGNIGDVILDAFAGLFGICFFIFLCLTIKQFHKK